MQQTSDICCSMTMKILFCSKMLLSILSPFLTNVPLVDFCINLLPPLCVWPPSLNESSLHSVADSSGYLWDSVCVPREDKRFKESWSTEILQSVGDSMISMDGYVLVNKLISQMSGAKSILDYFVEGSVTFSHPGTVTTVSYFYYNNANCH